MPPKKGRGKGRSSVKGKGSYSSWNDGGWGDWRGYGDYYSYNTSSSPKGCGQPVADVFGALEGEMDAAIPDVPSEVCLYIRKLFTLANDHEILKGASFDVPPDTNALCQRMANEVHRDVLPGDSHVTAMEPFKDDVGLRTSATTTPGLLKVMFVAMASRKIRVQKQLLGLGTAPAQRKRRGVQG